ncbi:DUF7331 family protein [Haloarcula litorea]|uniref:DUF7331 family protein n=1 Tax=Haloarcula litorea TaxID=3032579 RepID=UPI0023E8AD02|nr:hypothetical protein [Halomicroarcula sp. GDY20]
MSDDLERPTDAETPVDDRYAALRVDEELLIYDPDDADAWLQSSVAVELRP